MLSCTSDDEVLPGRHIGCLCHRPEIRSLARRLSTGMSRRGFVTGMGTVLSAVGLSSPGFAQLPPARSQPPILFTNARVFEGVASADEV